MAKYSVNRRTRNIMAPASHRTSTGMSQSMGAGSVANGAAASLASVASVGAASAPAMSESTGAASVGLSQAGRVTGGMASRSNGSAHSA